MTAIINKEFNIAYKLPENTIFEFDLLWRECLETFLDVVFTKFMPENLPTEHIDGGYSVGVKMNWGDTDYNSGLTLPTIEHALCNLFIKYYKVKEFQDIVQTVYQWKEK